MIIMNDKTIIIRNHRKKIGIKNSPTAIKSIIKNGTTYRSFGLSHRFCS